MPSPGEVVRAVLLKAELVIMPVTRVIQPYEDITPCYVGQNALPDSPDQILAIGDTAGRDYGRVQRTGKFLSHPGVKIELRHLDPLRGYDLMKRITDFLASRTTRQSVPIRGKECFVASIYQTSEIAKLGQEEGTNRYLWVANFRVVMEDTAELPIVE